MPDTPWWISEYQPSRVQDQRPQRGITSIAIVMAIIAGVVGALIGRATTNLHTQTNLVSAKSTIERAPDSIASIAARVSPSVVSISVSTPNGGDTGSGFFLTSSGYVLTNNHVVSAAADGGGSIRVQLINNKSYPASLVGRDAAYDLAVLKIDVTNPSNFTKILDAQSIALSLRQQINEQITIFLNRRSKETYYQ